VCPVITKDTQGFSPTYLVQLILGRLAASLQVGPDCLDLLSQRGAVLRQRLLTALLHFLLLLLLLLLLLHILLLLLCVGWLGQQHRDVLALALLGYFHLPSAITLVTAAAASAAGGAGTAAAAVGLR
jgi:hypothetical protein